MNERLVWNFEFTPGSNLALDSVVDEKDESLKWEIRYFWPNHEPIILNSIDKSLLKLTHYKQTQREDYYYLLPDYHLNIKKRRNQLFYKPLVKKTNQAMGYGKKIILDEKKPYSTYGHPLPLPEENGQRQDIFDYEPSNLMHYIDQKGIEILVAKEAFIYKLSTQPSVKIELARLEILQEIYFSLCIEGKSLNLVELISKHLLDEPISCDYITFLKHLLKL